MPERPRVPVATLPSGIPHVPAFDGEDSLDAAKEGATFLANFTTAVEQRDWQKFGELFSDNCFWKDSLTLTFDKRTLHGSEKIVEAWTTLSAARKPTGFTSTKEDALGMQAQFVRMAPVLATLDVPFSFIVDEPKSKCVGLAKLIPENGTWKIWVLATQIVSLVDYPFEPLPRISPSIVGHSQRGKAAAQGLPQINDVLDAVVVGANVSGLGNTIMLDSIGANVATFDREPVVGSTWQLSRYEGLTLHHPAFMIQLPLFPVPSDGYPMYLNGRDLAKYYKAAIETLNLPVFGGINVVGNSYDEAKGLWNVRLHDIRTEEETTVQSRNLVLASGFLVPPENPKMPDMGDQHLFHGPVQHTVEYRTSARYKDKDVIVVGSGNSAHDVAQNLALNGAKDVTILQRSPTVLMDFDVFAPVVTMRYSGDIPVETADFLESSMPIGLLRDMAGGMMGMLLESQTDKIAQLESKGYMMDRKPNLIARVYEERGRSFYIDHLKVFDLVFADRIKIARGEAKRFVPEGIVVHDKTDNEGKDKVLKADGVVFATGYDFADLPKHYAESGFIDAKSTSMLFDVGRLGVDEEGESPGYVTSSGHPHLYFAGIGFPHARWIGRFVAIQIMADVNGKFPQRYPRSF